MVDIQKVKLNATREDRLEKYEGVDKVISSSDYKKKIDSMSKPMFLFQTGLFYLDKITKGFESGELIVISGFTGHGKTSLAQSFTNKFSDKDYKSLWFSYEVQPRQFFKKFGNKLPKFHLPSELRGASMEWVEDRIIESKLKYETRIIFIDHLHYLVDMARTNHPSLEFGNIMRQLKQMANKHNILIFLIAHTSMPKGDKPPDIGSLRDSSFVTQESDSVMVIQRKKLDNGTYGNESGLFILKHRREGIMNKRVDLVYRDCNFFEKSSVNFDDGKAEMEQDIKFHSKTPSRPIPSPDTLFK